MNKKNGTIARPQGLAGEILQRGERLPYGAPWMETHLVAVEGGFAADGSLTGSNKATLSVDEWEDGDAPGAGTVLDDVKLL